MIKGDKASFIEVSQLVMVLKNKYTNWLENDHIPLTIKNKQNLSRLGILT